MSLTLKEGFLSLCAGQSAVALPGTDSFACLSLEINSFQTKSRSAIGVHR